MKFEKKIIRSYGLLSAHSFYCKPSTVEEIIECIDYAKQHSLSICPYGSGMSFSDVCLIDNNVSLDITGLDKIIKFDSVNGTITAQAGILTIDILSIIMPVGWYLCGLSGSLRNTIAGDISNNVNGKDSWKYGNFGNNVKSMKIALADGTVQEIDSDNNSELFYATIGGMGLLGIIVEVTLQLIKIPSYIIVNKSERFKNFDSLMNKMDVLDEKVNSFFYAWTDAFAKSDSFGRSIAETARFADDGEDVSIEKFNKGFIEKKRIGFLPPYIFWKLFGMIESQKFFMAANAMKYHFSGAESIQTKTFPVYQYPMIKHFPQWNLKYLPKGFHEFQPVFPKNNFKDAFSAVLKVCRQYDCLPQLCAIRKHKKESYYLSFSEDGYSFTINYPLKAFTAKVLEEFNRKLIDAVLHYNGKIYLGKFPFITPSECKEMYPLYNQFLDIKNRVDPNKIFSSNAAPRLFA